MASVYLRSHNSSFTPINSYPFHTHSLSDLNHVDPFAFLRMLHVFFTCLWLCLCSSVSLPGRSFCSYSFLNTHLTYHIFQTSVKLWSLHWASSRTLELSQLCRSCAMVYTLVIAVDQHRQRFLEVIKIYFLYFRFL